MSLFASHIFGLSIYIFHLGSFLACSICLGFWGFNLVINIVLRVVCVFSVV